MITAEVAVIDLPSSEAVPPSQHAVADLHIAQLDGGRALQIGLSRSHAHQSRCRLNGDVNLGAGIGRQGDGIAAHRLDDPTTRAFFERTRLLCGIALLPQRDLRTQQSTTRQERARKQSHPRFSIGLSYAFAPTTT